MFQAVAVELKLKLSLESVPRMWYRMDELAR